MYEEPHSILESRTIERRVLGTICGRRHVQRKTRGDQSGHAVEWHARRVHKGAAGAPPSTARNAARFVALPWRDSGVATRRRLQKSRPWRHRRSDHLVVCAPTRRGRIDLDLRSLGTREAVAQMRGAPPIGLRRRSANCPVALARQRGFLSTARRSAPRRAQVGWNASERGPRPSHVKRPRSASFRVALGSQRRARTAWSIKTPSTASPETAATQRKRRVDAKSVMLHEGVNHP